MPTPDLVSAMETTSISKSPVERTFGTLSSTSKLFNCPKNSSSITRPLAYNLAFLGI